MSEVIRRISGGFESTVSSIQYKNEKRKQCFHFYLESKKKRIHPRLLIEVVIYSLSLGVGYNEHYFTDQCKSKKLPLFS